VNRERKKQFELDGSCHTSRFSPRSYQVLNDLRHEGMCPHVIGDNDRDRRILLPGMLHQLRDVPCHVCTCLQEEWNDHDAVCLPPDATFQRLLQCGWNILQECMLDISLATGASKSLNDLPDRPVGIAAPASMTKYDDRGLQRSPILPCRSDVSIIAACKSQWIIKILERWARKE